MTPAANRDGRRGLSAWLQERFNLTEIVSLLGSFGLLPSELDSRRPVGEALRDALARPLPSYARWPRALGLVSFLLFVFLGVTGGLLAFYYQPTATEAHASVTTIVRDVQFGWLVHQVHGWAALLFLILLLARLVRFFVQGVYKTPREAIWILALLTFLLAMHADLTGRLLAWDGAGYWTTVRALEVVYALPVLGPVLSFLAGGDRIDGLVLTRFYVLHVVVLPPCFVALFYLHFSGVRRLGLSALPGTTRGGPAVHRMYLLNFLILTVLILGGLVTLATLWPAPFSSAADPSNTPPGVRPPWYLLASHALLESFPSFLPRWVRGLVLEGILLAALLWPFLDRTPGGTPRERRTALAAGAIVFGLWLLLTWHGYLLEAGR